MSNEPTRQRDQSPSPPPMKKRKVVESTTTKKAVSSFFTPTSKKEPDRITWRVVNATLLFARHRPIPPDHTKEPPAKRQKIAAFDLDYTLIQTLSGNIFSKDATDWRWWDPLVPGALRKLHINGYHICILTNQGSISLATSPDTLKSDAKTLSTFKTKVTAILSHFDFPVTLLAATARDRYRKPRTGMWTELLEELDLHVERSDPKAFFFVGDAGGRAATTSRKADHACSDRDFAINAGIDFKTPEEYFLNEGPSPFTRTFEPSLCLDTAIPASTDATPIVFEKRSKLDLVIMCGSPASGKSTFYWTKLKPLGYERVNQDILKTRDNCVKVATSFLAEATSVTVDNTNADPETRAVWISLGAKYSIPVRCLYFTASAKLCEHNDTVRALASDEEVGKFNPEKRTILPHSAFAGFASRFKEPKLTEGLQDIVKFQGNDDQKRIWSQYWI